MSPEEQEQWDRFKEWWQAYSLWLILGVAVGVGGVGSWKGWEIWQERQATEAAEHFWQYRDHMEAGRSEEARGVVDLLRTEYGSTLYASMAVLMAARQAADVRELEEAVELLRWVRAESGDVMVTSLATLRLARLHGDRKEWKEGLAVLEEFSVEGLEGLAHEIRGDLYRGNAQPEEARHEYAMAMEKGEADEFLRWKQADITALLRQENE